MQRVDRVAMAQAAFELRTKDAQDVKSCLGGVVGPFQLEADSGPYDARLRHDRLGPASFISVEYGGAVAIRGALDVPGLLLHWPVRGAFEARSLSGQRDVSGSRAQAHVVRSGARMHLSSSADCRFLMISVPDHVLHQAALALGGEGLRLPPTMPEAVNMGGAGAALARCLEFLYAESRRADGLLLAEGGAGPAGQMLLSALLSALVPGARPQRAQPGYMKRAEEFLDANLPNPIGVADVVAVANVSVRTLHQGFRARHQVGPMGWLRQRRLDRAHAELGAADPEESQVGDIALRLGFTHLGRFSVQYRQRFGESPSATLRRR